MCFLCMNVNMSLISILYNCVFIFLCLRDFLLVCLYFNIYNDKKTNKYINLYYYLDFKVF